MWFGFGVMLLGACLTPGWAAAAEVAAMPAYGGAGNGARGTQGYLGIDVRDVSEGRGAEIIKVDHDGPAGKMGLREHDVVLQMNGVVIEGEEPIRRMLRDTAPGRAVVLVISRDGRQITVSGQMADQVEVEREAWERHFAPGSVAGSVPPGPQAPATGLPAGESSLAPAANGGSAPVPQSRYSKGFLGTFLPNPTYTGVLLEVMGPQLAAFFAVPGGTGLLVHSVDPNSPAAMAGIRAGDIVTKANYQAVASPGQWTRVIRDSKGRPVTVTVMRDRQERTVTLVPDSKKRSGSRAPAELDEFFEGGGASAAKI